MHALDQKLMEAKAQRAALKQLPNFREDVVKAMAMIEDLWTVHLPRLLESELDAEISPGCRNSTLEILSKSFKPGATVPDLLPLLDATGKQGAGLLAGNLVLDAAFDECFNYNYTGFCMGRFELSFIPPSIPLSWTAGLCVPKHCTPSDVITVLRELEVFEVADDGFLCSDTKVPAYSPGAILMILVCLLFAMLVVLGTAVDKILDIASKMSRVDKLVAINDTDNDASGRSGGEGVPLLLVGEKKPLCKVKFHEFITAFSLYKTLPALFATKQAASVITSMNGLRVMSMFWVILGHVYVWVLFTGQGDNITQIIAVMKRFSFQAVGNAFFAVDSFFFLSGVLVAYLTFRQMKKTGRFPVLHYYIHRYLRLTPTYAFVLFFAWFLTEHLATGPGFSLMSSFAGPCKKYWWTNLLYFNNLYPWKQNDQCIGWTWYLANDMQFYVIAPLILIPMYYLFPIGLVISSVMQH